MAEPQRGWDDPSWHLEAAEAVLSARATPGASNANPQPREIVARAARNGPDDATVEQKCRRISNEARRSLGLLIDEKLASSFETERSFIESAVRDRHGRAVASATTHSFGQAVINLDRAIERGTTADPTGGLRALVASALGPDLRTHVFRYELHKELRRRERSGTVTNDERLLALNWLQHLDQAPETSATVWLNTILRDDRERNRLGRLADPDLHLQLVEALAACNECSWPEGLDRATMSSRAMDKVIKAFTWRDRLNDGPLDVPVEAYVGSVRRTVIPDEFVDRDRHRPTDPVTLGMLVRPVGGTAGSSAHVDWLHLLGVLESDTFQAPERCAETWKTLGSLHPKTRGLVCELLELTVIVSTKKAAALRRAIAGDPTAKATTGEFLGGLRVATSGHDPTGKWLAPDLLLALADKEPEWRERYADAEPDSNSKALGANEVANESGDYRRYLRWRTGLAAAEIVQQDANENAAGQVVALFPLTTAELLRMSEADQAEDGR